MEKNKYTIEEQMKEDFWGKRLLKLGVKILEIKKLSPLMRFFTFEGYVVTLRLKNRL